jgi:hypothetical protein
MGSTITFVLPTNKASAALDVFGSSESLRALAKLLAARRCGLSVVGQGAFGFAQFETLRDRALAAGFATCVFTATYQQRPPPMAALREKAFRALPADFAFFADDNLEFTNGTPSFAESSGERYLRSIEFLEANPRCGVVSHGGTLGGATFGTSIRRVRNHFVTTARGLIFRANGQLYDQDHLAIRGGFEDQMAACRLFDKGFWHAKQMNVPTRHKGFSAMGARRPDDDCDLHSVAGFQPFLDWFASKYGRAFPCKVAPDGVMDVGSFYLKGLWA